MKRHPLYSAALATWQKRPGQSVSIPLTDVAKLIRGALKARFPRATFSVRCSRYAGGASIDVNWTDGPTQRLVEEVIKPFAGSGFDGMQDMKYGLGGWLMPDGSASFRKIEAHWGTPDTAIEPAKDGALPVSFGVDFVFARREISRAAMERALVSFGQRHPGDPLAEAIRAGEVRVADRRWGYEVEGADRFRTFADGREYGGATALRIYAHRRMIAA